ncbi:MAG: HAD-IC family P-type ATPase, partial [Bacteroidetes bacterium]|nr:HAD-IC family P-type ATPase [Bacteroidota bacterium]
MPSKAGITPDTAYWSLPVGELLTTLSSSPEGLTDEEAERRLPDSHPTKIKTYPLSHSIHLFLLQFKSPITLLLVFASLLSFFLGEKPDAFIILAILLISALLGFLQERGASNALSKLLGLVQVQTPVLRNGQIKNLPSSSIAPGDIIILDAGCTIPGDCRLLESKELHTNESSLTGESFPVEKFCTSLPAPTTLAARTNSLFMGTHVISGAGKALVVKTGPSTVFGGLSSRLRQLQPETDFERGIRRFGYLLLEVTLLLVMVIFAINIFLHKPVLDAFLFSLAIAVGLTPQLLPAIITINLAKGATSMARRSVIVKRLASIENFGSMNTLCCDKTGTLTTGEIVLIKAIDPAGTEKDEVFRLAYLNAIFEQGFANPIDQAIRNHKTLPTTDIHKSDEIPYDFIRRRLSILLTESPDQPPLMISKGAFDNILSCCSPLHDIETARHLYTTYSQEGYRILGIAIKHMPQGCRTITKEDEKDMTFAGLLLFSDPPKPNIRNTLEQLSGLGIDLKIITGDNALIAAHIAKAVGLPADNILTGAQIHNLSVEALSRLAE